MTTNTERHLDASEPENGMRRYARQVNCDKLGVEGQRRLRKSRVVLIGCGALGSRLASMMVRGGVGYLRIYDRDVVEEDNLHRQILFVEEHAEQSVPKAEAAVDALAKINSTVEVESHVLDVARSNIHEVVKSADLILDGTDNFSSRMLINDVAIEQQIPWVYGGVVGATGMMMAILPGATPCLRCLFREIPPACLTPTAAVAGVLAPAVAVAAGLQAMEAIKILSGSLDAVCRCLKTFDLWSGTAKDIGTSDLSIREECPCCVHKRFEFLYP